MKFGYPHTELDYTGINGLKASNPGPGSYSAPSSFKARSYGPIYRVIPQSKESKRASSLPLGPGAYEPKSLESHVSTLVFRKGPSERFPFERPSSAGPAPGAYYLNSSTNASGSRPSFSFPRESRKVGAAGTDFREETESPGPGDYPHRPPERSRHALMRLSESRMQTSVDRAYTPGPGTYSGDVLNVVVPSAPSYSFSYSSRFNGNAQDNRLSRARILLSSGALRKLRVSQFTEEELEARDFVSNNVNYMRNLTPQAMEAQRKKVFDEREDRLKKALEQKRRLDEEHYQYRTALLKRKEEHEKLVQLQARQKRWLVLIVTLHRTLVIWDSITRARGVRQFENMYAKQMARARKYANVWRGVVRRRRAARASVVLSRFMRLCRVRMHQVKRKRAATIIRAFLRQLSATIDTVRVIKNFRYQVSRCQRLVRSYLSVVHAQVELLLRQWDSVEHPHVTSLDDAASSPQRDKRKKGKKNPDTKKKKKHKSAASSVMSDLPTVVEESESALPYSIRVAVLSSDLRKRRRAFTRRYSEWRAKKKDYIEQKKKQERMDRLREMVKDRSGGGTDEDIRIDIMVKTRDYFWLPPQHRPPRFRALVSSANMQDLIENGKLLAQQTQAQSSTPRSPTAPDA